MALKIIGAGFGRTGTASLKIALEQLGLGPCYHMSEVLTHPGHIEHWIRAADGHPDWDTIYDGYHAAVDFPSCLQYRALMEKYPGAKVILTTRDPERWFESVHATIMSPRLVEFTAASPMGEMSRKTFWGYFENRLNDREHMIRRYNEHAKEVRDSVPADRLLVFEASMGWEPLCAFLDAPIPSTPYPHVNSKEETAKLFAMMMDKGHAPEEAFHDSVNEIFKAQES